jgi:hypothetical protein
MHCDSDPGVKVPPLVFSWHGIVAQQNAEMRVRLPMTRASYLGARRPGLQQLPPIYRCSSTIRGEVGESTTNDSAPQVRWTG